MNPQQCEIKVGEVEPGTIIFIQGETLLVLDINCGSGGMVVLRKYISDCIWAINLNKNAPWALDPKERVFVLGKIPSKSLPEELSFKPQV